jgi:uncharacterized protein (TIGR03437 family)
MIPMRPVLSAIFLSLIPAAAALCQTATPATPGINPGGILNLAGSPSSGAVAPGSLVSIFGANLAAGMTLADTVPLSMTVGGVSVTVGGLPAPIQSVGANQISIQIPWETPTSDSAGPAAVVVTSNGTPSAPLNITVTASAPAIFSLAGQAYVVNGDGTLAAPANSIAGIVTHPAVIADPNGIVIFATGMGAVDTAIADGANSSDLTRNTLSAPTVTIGGMNAQVTYSGLSPQFVGVNQINVTIPPGTPTGPAVPLQIQITGPDGVIMSNLVTIAVSSQ